MRGGGGGEDWVRIDGGLGEATLARAEERREIGVVNIKCLPRRIIVHFREGLFGARSVTSYCESRGSLVDVLRESSNVRSFVIFSILKVITLTSKHF